MFSIIFKRIINYSLFVICFCFVQHSVAQEVKVIDNKGTIKDIRNNTVTSAPTASPPTTPLEGDVWFDTTLGITQIYDATSTSWITVDNTIIRATTAPVSPNVTVGDIWFDTSAAGATPTAQTAQMWDGTTWVGFETVTSLAQNLTTGVITYTDEVSGTQTANVVSTNTDPLDGSPNDIIVGTDGGAYYQMPIKAFGKINADGTAATIAGATSVRLTGGGIGNGQYRITFITPRPNANYVIQLTVLDRNGAGNDDPDIAYFNQTATSFDVRIGDNDNGSSNRNRYNSEFMFTVIDF